MYVKEKKKKKNIRTKTKKDLRNTKQVKKK